MFIIGITGSICSGKSTVARMLGDMADIRVIETDSILRELTRPDSEALVYIGANFGESVINDDCSLNRKRLGQMVLADSGARVRLNKILFPLIRKAVIEKFNAYSKAGNKYVIFDAPLLYESGMDELVDYTVLVHASRDIQIQRLQIKNNLTIEEARAKINAHPYSNELFLKQKDYFIRNTSDFNSLNGMVTILWKRIQSAKKRK